MASVLTQTPRERPCRGCGRRDGTHDDDCQAARRDAKEKLQAECDHRPEYGLSQTTGDVLGPPCCGRCGIELRKLLDVRGK